MKKKLKFLLLILGIIFISNIAFASYYELIEGNVTAELKIPVFELNKEDEIKGQISSVNQNYYESTFEILNYIEDKNVLSEIPYQYKIKLIPSTGNFPVKYRLLDLDNNLELELDSNLETSEIQLGTEKENHHYQVIVEWDMENSNQELEEKFQLEIQVKGVQSQ